MTVLLRSILLNELCKDIGLSLKNCNIPIAVVCIYVCGHIGAHGFVSANYVLCFGLKEDQITWTLKEAHLVSCQEAWTKITMIFMQGILKMVWDLLPTTYLCTRYIIGVFTVTLHCLQRRVICWWFGKLNKWLNFASDLVILTLFPQCSTMNSSKIFSYTTTCFNFIFLTMGQSLVKGPDWEP